MFRKLYRAAFISSPIIGLIGSTPLYVVEKLQLSSVFVLWIILTVVVFIFWSINISIISKIGKTNSTKRYFVSFVMILLAQSINIFFIRHLNLGQIPFKSTLFPMVPAIAINAIILIISNSIILQFQKESAELEVKQLKVNNLEAQKLILLQQLQPHFLFNALSTLKSLIGENAGLAEDYVVKLSDFLRYSVQAKNNEIVNLSEELKFTHDYIQLQKVRFGDSFICEIEIPEQVFSKKIPVYALQTLVENAIKHNAFTDKKPLIIKVTTEGNRLKVNNNLLPKALNNQSGTGLENLNQRYQLIADRQIEVVKTANDFTVFINLI
jgi:two-component system, LytTR family, sensor kinase